MLMGLVIGCRKRAIPTSGSKEKALKPLMPGKKEAKERKKKKSVDRNLKVTYA